MHSYQVQADKEQLHVLILLPLLEEIFLQIKDKYDIGIFLCYSFVDDDFHHFIKIVN